MLPTHNPDEGRASDKLPDLATDSPPALDPDLLDPFHPENLRLDQSYLEQPAGRSCSQRFQSESRTARTFRVHPSEEYRVSLAAMITLKDDNDTFLVHPSFVSELAHGEFYHATLYLVMNRQKVISIWPVKQTGPDSGGKPNLFRTEQREPRSQMPTFRSTYPPGPGLLNAMTTTAAP